MANPALNAIGFILGILFNLYATVVAVRFVMQVVRADYYNPLAEAVVKLTDPPLRPLRRLIPSIKRYDTASLVLVFIVLLLKILIFKLLGLSQLPVIGSYASVAQMPLPNVVILTFLDVIYHFFNVFIFALIINAILSWIPNSSGNPAQAMVAAISEPVVRPLRNIIPPIGGLDLTVFLTIIGLFALRMFVIDTLRPLAGL